jgi:hypothetical protein
MMRKKCGNDDSPVDLRVPNAQLGRGLQLICGWHGLNVSHKRIKTVCGQTLKRSAGRKHLQSQRFKATAFSINSSDDRC